MLKTAPTPKAMRNLLLKRGHKNLLTKFEETQAKLNDAIAKKLVSVNEIQYGYAPKEFMDLYAQQAKTGAILQQHLNAAISEVEAFEADPDAVISQYDYDDAPSSPNAPLSAKDRYMQNPNRENGFAMVKESLGLKANMLDDNQVYRHEKEQQENVDRTLALIADQQAKEFAAAEKRQREKEEDFRKHGNQLDAAAREVMNDNRIRPVAVTPNNQSLEKLVQKAKSYTEGYE